MKQLKANFLYILLFFVTGIVSTSYATIDSVGVETVDGKVMILHRVETKETLYSISKIYNVTSDEITSANPGSEMGIGIGQILKIPTKIGSPSEEEVQSESIEEPTVTDENESKKTHIVKPGETLYAISTLYPCSVDEIKEWNNLTSNALEVGQEIIINKDENETSEPIIPVPIETAEDVATESKEETISTSEETKEEGEIKTENVVKTEESKTEETSSGNLEETVQEEIKEKKIPNDRPIDIDIQIRTREEIDKENTKLILQNSSANDSLPSKRTEDMDGYTKEFEKGYAVLMEGTGSDERYLAHHRTLPEGTILQIKNLENGKNVFVRIVGVLEHDDPKVIISLSSKAETRLNSINSTFLTEISFIP